MRQSIERRGLVWLLPLYCVSISKRRGDNLLLKGHWHSLGNLVLKCMSEHGS